MGFGDVDLLDDGAGRGKAAPSTEWCSICLEVVMDNGDRSWAKLQCGHQFHLDCIGSAFNSKGAMQCPNCRKIEKGQWLYANCSRQPELSMDDWPNDDDLYDLSFSEMSFGVHWCPFSGLTRLPSSFDLNEGEFSSSAYHDFLGQHIFAEHASGSSTNHHQCPFFAYIGPIQPSSSISSGNVSDGSNLNNHWSGSSVPNQPSIQSATQRTSRSNSDMARHGSFVPPFLVGHSSAGRAPSSINSSVIPPYNGGGARGVRDRVQSLQGYLQRSSNNPMGHTPLTSVGRRSSSHRGSSQVAPLASTPDQSSGFYFYSSGSSGRTFPEEHPIPNHFNPWEREHLLPFQVDRDSIWGPFYPSASGSGTGIRSSSHRQRHGAERALSQN